MKNQKSYSGAKLKHGQILAVSVIFMSIILILTSNLFNRTADFLRFGSGTIIREQANSLAEAGIDRALWQLNKTAGSYTGETNTALSTVGTFSTTVTNKSANIKTITATGYVPSSSNPRGTRTIKVDVSITSTIIAFNYAVQVGIGGITMNNSSKINGSVYSNANISGTGPSSITGDAFAVGTVSSPPSVDGITRENQPPATMPVIDYPYWRGQADVNHDSITCSPTCTISTSTSIGPKQYNGNLTISNNAIVTMNGPIYVTGNFSMVNGSTTLQLNNSFGSNGSVLIVDGTIDLSNGGLLSPTNANPKGYILAATTSSAIPAITVANSGATAIFAALDGGAEMRNSAQVSALVAKSLLMKNSAQLFYDQGLANSAFTSGPGASWQVIKGTYRYK